MEIKKVGIDEVGCGAWAGPIYVVGFCEALSWNCEGLKDSKKMTSQEISKFAAVLQKQEHLVDIISVETIDTEGFGDCLLRAYRRVAKHFRASYPDCLVEIDGTRLPSGIRNIQGIPKGDTLIPHIQAAAIIAKHLRDQEMVALATQHPGYGWEQNVGYGVPVHRDGLSLHGVTPHHRVSFRPVRKFLRDPPNPIGSNPVTASLYTAWKVRAHGVPLD